MDSSQESSVSQSGSIPLSEAGGSICGSCDTSLATSSEAQEQENDDVEQLTACRLCHGLELHPTTMMIEPCLCTEPSRYVHKSCFKDFILSDVESIANRIYCQICDQKYQILVERKTNMVNRLDYIVLLLVHLVLLLIQLIFAAEIIYATYNLLFWLISMLIASFEGVEKWANKSDPFNFLWLSGSRIFFFVMFLVCQLGMIQENSDENYNFEVFDRSHQLPEDPELLQKLEEIAQDLS